MSTCLIGVHAIHFRPTDVVYELVEIVPLRLTSHVWVDPRSSKVIERIDPLITFTRTGMGRVGTFTQDTVLLKLTPIGTEGVSSHHACDLAEAIWDAGMYGAAVDKALGPGAVLTLYALARRQLSREPAPQREGEKTACSFVTMWEFHGTATGATFVGVLDLSLEASRRKTVALAGGLSQLLADSGEALSQDVYRAIASAEAYLRRLVVDPRWPAAEIRAQLTAAGESLGDGATAGQVDLLRELAQRFGVSADDTSPGEM